MVTNVNEAIDFVNSNDVKFIKMQFCDIFGALKNISIVPSQLERAFKEGISFDASSVKGFLNESESDLLLFPSPTTLSVLPWRPQQGRVVRFFCDIKRPDGTQFEGDCRRILRDCVMAIQREGWYINIGPECEFYLFETDQDSLPTTKPFDTAGYFDVAPVDKGENVRREICLMLEEMGLEVESSHHESGPAQHEVCFKYSGAFTAADNLITFKTVVKSIAARNGLFASFMPKPLDQKSGSGLHINLSINHNGKNLFEDEMTAEAKSFIAGVMEHIRGICAVTNPLVNSYKRIGGGFEAPKSISWSPHNRAQLIRIPAALGDYSRMELRNPDPALNPYLAFALVIEAGLDGIKRKLTLPEKTSGEVLPSSLAEALDCAEADPLIKAVLGDHVFSHYIEKKREEWVQYEKTVHKWELDRYFYTV